jgi:ABC-type nickel/cobalt efflux system permease component RcnA
MPVRAYTSASHNCTALAARLTHTSSLSPRRSANPRRTPRAPAPQVPTPVRPPPSSLSLFAFAWPRMFFFNDRVRLCRVPLQLCTQARAASRGMERSDAVPRTFSLPCTTHRITHTHAHARTHTHARTRTHAHAHARTHTHARTRTAATHVLLLCVCNCNCDGLGRRWTRGCLRER